MSPCRRATAGRWAPTWSDGVWSGTWRLVRGDATALALEPFGDAPEVSGDVLAEAAALAEWLGASHVVSPSLVGDV